MTSFDRRKLIETVLYILEKTGGVDFYHTFKILYYAEMKHLAKWGSKIISDDFCSLPYGPAPTKLYDAVKQLGSPSPNGFLAQELDEAVRFAGEDAPQVLLGRRSPDMSYISTSESEALDAAIGENATLSFAALMQKSHDAAWEEAYKNGSGTKVISPLSMAKVMNADASILEYIQEQELIKQSLS